MSTRKYIRITIGDFNNPDTLVKTSFTPVGDWNFKEVTFNKIVKDLLPAPGGYFTPIEMVSLNKLHFSIEKIAEIYDKAKKYNWTDIYDVNKKVGVSITYMSKSKGINRIKTVKDGYFRLISFGPQRMI